MVTQNELKAFEPNDTYEYIKLKKGYTQRIQTQSKDNTSYKLFFTTTRLKYVGRLEDGKTVSGLNGLEWKMDYPFLGEGTWRTYRKFYTHLVSNLTNHFHKKRHIHPLTYDFLDVDGSRSRWVTFNRNTIPHLHSIYLVHPGTLERWNDLREQSFKKVTDHKNISPFVESFHAVPIYNLPGIVAYASKFYDVEQMRRIRDDYQLYNLHGPITAAEKEALKEERERLPFYAEVQANRELWAEMIAQNPQLEGWWAS
jgi:hypothetical protein